MIKNNDYIIELNNITKIYNSSCVAVKALDSVSVSVPEGKLVIILGHSGSGKSTLLNIIGGMDIPNSGEVMFKGTPLKDYSEKKMTQFRKNHIGFVFQAYNLLDDLTVYENIRLAAKLSHSSIDAENIIKIVGLDGKQNNYPSQLSGGEQQRTAIARALVKDSDLILCDEPTGALDSDNSQNVFKLLEELVRKHNKTVVIVTHNNVVKDIADIVIYMKNGTISNIVHNNCPQAVSEVDWQ